MLHGFYPATSMPDSDWWQSLWPRPEQVVAALGIKAGADTIVDLCCGDGLFTAALAPLTRRVVALDLDPKLLELTRSRMTSAGATNADFIAGDAYDIATLVRTPADAVLIANTFHGVPEKQRLARAVALTLKPSGYFIVVNWHRRPREATVVLGQPRGPATELRMEPADVVLAAEPAGFALARIVELPPYHYAAMLVLRSSAKSPLAPSRSI